jgi:hypothetical protein
VMLLYAATSCLSELKKWCVYSGSMGQIIKFAVVTGLTSRID